MKSKMIAYGLWFFLGVFGAHKFYLDKIGMGILYFCTGGIFGIGLFIDLFTLGGQVDTANAMMAMKQGMFSGGGNNSQNVVVNVSAPAAVAAPAPQAQSLAVSKTPEQSILQLTAENEQLSIKEIMMKTGLEMETIEGALEKFIAKGIAREHVGEDGKLRYDFS
jgi:TM2 domain-containing membrane protein YozV